MRRLIQSAQRFYEIGFSVSSPPSDGEIKAERAEDKSLNIRGAAKTHVQGV